IESVARKNIISGYGDDTYKPEKYMSRQEFAVVADNYIHYLGYTTEDPTVLDNIAYGDQKFVAPWAQDAVRELAYLGFTNYAPGTLFNPEKYVTRAEAAEIAYRMTQKLDRTVVVSKGKLNQAQLEEYQSDAIALYQQKEPQGKILSISPNTDTSALLITVDSIQKSTLKAFKKKFHDNVFLQLPPEPLTKSDGNTRSRKIPTGTYTVPALWIESTSCCKIITTE
ncbi:MAG: S-layer homology domain-containing protein, partial [Veillonella sp.]|nr:S-layer homology domain-containing protein [Veillonella sp.]